MSSPFITIKDLSITRGSVTILDEVDLTAREGAFLGVVGPNGAGKTTLLRAIDGSISTTTGSIHIGDIAIESADATTISQQVASVPQDTSISFNFDGRTIIEMGRTPHRSRFATWTETDDTAVEQAINQVDADAFVDQPVTTLSGGEQQRILLARALAQQTPVLLLDEPTASLDIHRQIQTLESVARLVETGKTAIAAIHDLNLAARYCDTICLLAGGSITATGPPAEVLTTPTLAEAFGGYPIVTTDLITGTASVTTLPDERSKTTDNTTNNQSTHEQHGESAIVGDSSEYSRETSNQPIVHIIGHGQPVITAMSELVAAGYTVTVGPVPARSVTATTADRVATSVMTTPAYKPITESMTTELRSKIDAAAAVVLANVDLTKSANAIVTAMDYAENIITLTQQDQQQKPQHDTTHDNLTQTPVDELPYSRDTVNKKITDNKSIVSVIEELLASD